ncbi:MAG: SH3 domain-containing protein [Janthinobacterium lividum]
MPVVRLRRLIQSLVGAPNRWRKAGGAMLSIGLLLPTGAAAQSSLGNPAALPPPHHLVLHPKPTRHTETSHHAARPEHPAHAARPAHHGHPVVTHPVRHPTPPPVPPPVPVVAAPVVPPVALKGTNTGLPIPRFASLRADDVNLRGGPGTRYPIQWVYKRRDLPVEIEREFDVWRLIEDSDGVKGWVHQATLVGSRSFVVVAATIAQPAAETLTASAETPVASRNQVLRIEPKPDAAVVAILKPGVIGRIRTCPAGSDWCRVSLKAYSGWLLRSAFWGLLPGETILPP